MSYGGDVPQLGFRPSGPRVLGMGTTNSPSGPMGVMVDRTASIPTPWVLHPCILRRKQRHHEMIMDLVSVLSLEHGSHRVSSES